MYHCFQLMRPVQAILLTPPCAINYINNLQQGDRRFLFNHKLGLLTKAKTKTNKKNAITNRKICILQPSLWMYCCVKRCNLYHTLFSANALIITNKV